MTRACRRAGFRDYIIDFALSGGSFGAPGASADAERVWVIELNPGMTSTDGALFSWRHDGELLRNGRADGQVEFRVRDKYESSVRAQLEHRWRALLVEQ